MTTLPRFLSPHLALATLSVFLGFYPARADETAPTASKPEPRLTSTIFEWDKMPVKKTATGERREIVDGSTPSLVQFRSHVTTLNPGTPWTTLEKHTDEEILILKEGTLEFEFHGHLQTAGPGAVILIVAGDMHRFHNVGSTPATYYVFHPVTAESKAAADALAKPAAGK